MSSSNRGFHLLGGDIIKAFDQLQASLANSSLNITLLFGPKEVEAESQRFEIWAINLGLFETGHKSLAYRLQDAESVQNYVDDLLKKLLSYLQDLSSQIFDGEIDEHLPLEDDPADFSDPEEIQDMLDELAEMGFDAEEPVEIWGKKLFESIDNIINRLYELATIIRGPYLRPAPKKNELFKFLHLDRDAEAQFILQEQAREAHRVEALIVQIRLDAYEHSMENTTDEGRYNDSRISITEEDRNLINRLCQASFTRRWQFYRWRRQHESSSQSLDLMVNTLQRETARENRLGGDTETPDKQQIPSAEAPSRTQPSHPSSVTRVDPQKFAIPENKTTISGTSRALTIKGASGETIMWPRPPKKAANDKYFECPYCFMLCPEKYLEDKAWQAHLIHDLRPYSCTYGHCLNGVESFETWNEWAAHENFYHGSCWRCLSHPYMGFDDCQSYEAHIMETHDPKEQKALLVSEALEARRTVSNQADRPCPFCHANLPDRPSLQKHIAFHLYVIALHALPCLNGSDSDDDDMDSKSSLAVNQKKDSHVGSSENLSHISSGTQVGLQAKRWTFHATGLESIVSEKDLREIFQAAGNITNMKILPDDNNSGDNQAFIQYDDREKAEKSLPSLKGCLVHGKQLYVNKAYKFNIDMDEDTNEHYRIFVGNLSNEFSDEDLFQTFAAFGSISETRIICDMETGQSCGYGFVAFRQRDDAEEAIRTWNGQWLADFQIQCQWASEYIHQQHQSLQQEMPEIERVDCHICGRDFAGAYIDTHIKTQHERSIFFRCTHDGCNWMFQKRKRWVAHHKTKHTTSSSDGPVQCVEQCCLVVHNDDGFECPRCGLIFRGSDSKNDHNGHLKTCSISQGSGDI